MGMERTIAHCSYLQGLERMITLDLIDIIDLAR